MKCIGCGTREVPHDGHLGYVSSVQCKYWLVQRVESGHRVPAFSTGLLVALISADSIGVFPSLSLADLFILNIITAVGLARNAPLDSIY